ncbi:hypothetical protein PspLS_04808 [Pyricularia sp. CBS 133598]|nr:hypothetical protein PspLS_04808 [Pyricularia sp. CBS 133598]
MCAKGTNHRREATIDRNGEATGCRGLGLDADHVVGKQLTMLWANFRMVTMARSGQSNGPLVNKVCGRGLLRRRR